MAASRSRSIDRPGSKLNLPAMPHMSGSRQMGLLRRDDAASRQLIEVDAFERADHAIERVARVRLAMRGAAESRRQIAVADERADAIGQRLRVARLHEESRSPVVDELDKAAD